MAISGSFYGKTSNSAIKPKISWTAAENIAGNYSDVTAKLSYSRTDSYMTYGHWAGSLTINGDKKSVSGKYVEITKNSNTVTISHTVRVPHNDDGTKTVTISATGGITDTTLTKTTISGAVTLVSIPRAASIAATDADIGSVSMVTIGRKSDIYTYTVAYRFGALTGFLSETGLAEAAVFVNTASLAFPLPESFYYEIPSKPSDLCTLTCTTFLDGAPIGEPQQTNFTVRADPGRCAPVMSASAEDICGKTLQLTKDPSLFIRYASDALCAMTVQGQYGAEITERKLNGETVTQNTVTLPKVETDQLRFIAKDSRGYTAELPVHLNMIPYFVPVLRLSAARTDATSGDAVLQAEGSFYNGSFGAKANSLQVQYQINGGEPVPVVPEVEKNTFRLREALQNLDYTQAYQISLTVSDAVSQVTGSVRINPGIPVFDWGREDIRFNVPVNLKDGCDIQKNGEKAYAPSGYGLGATIPDIKIADLNSTTANGWYRIANQSLTVGGYTYSDWFVHVSKYSTKYLVQEMYTLNGYKAVRLCRNGTWYEEWDNPPMTTGVEYRTTDRMHAKAVYKKADANGSISYRLDGETAWYPEGTGIVKLWANAKPTSTFDAHKVSVDLSKYQMVAIEYRFNTTDDYRKMYFGNVGSTMALDVVSTSGYLGWRSATVSTTGISFSTATYNKNSGVVGYIIPVAIYGIKGVSA